MHFCVKKKVGWHICTHWHLRALNSCCQFLVFHCGCKIKFSTFFLSLNEKIIEVFADRFRIFQRTSRIFQSTLLLATNIDKIDKFFYCKKYQYLDFQWQLNWFYWSDMPFLSIKPLIWYLNVDGNTNSISKWEWHPSEDKK